MTANDHADVIARAIADPVAWVPDLFNTDPDLCDDSPLAPDEPLCISDVRLADPLDAVIFACEAVTRDEAAQWLADRLAGRRDRRKPAPLDDAAIAPLAALSFQDYWEARDVAAAKLGIRMSQLHEAVLSYRRARDRTG